jgi:glutathione peroxidase
MKNKKTIMIKIAIALGVVVAASVLMKKQGMSYRQSILKTIYPAIMWSSKAAGKKQIQWNQENKTPLVPIYSLTTKDINGKDFDFSTVKGKKILLVNTASDCGFTGQYEALEKLQEKYSSSLVVIGFPANDFKEQESKDNESIATFCKKNYGVSFPLMSKSVVVKKQNQNEVFRWLSEASMNGWNQQAPVWNFCKYLVNEQGVLTHYFPMTVDPLDASVVEAIEKK